MLLIGTGGRWPVVEVEDVALARRWRRRGPGGGGREGEAHQGEERGPGGRRTRRRAAAQGVGGV